MQLDLSNFNKAIISLEKALNELEKSPNEFIKSATIKSFEYTYELLWKMLKRYLVISEPSSEEIIEMSFADLIRTGNQRGLLLSDWSVWVEYRNNRNITSHTYDEKKAEQVLLIVPKFHKEALFLYDKLLLKCQ